MKTPQAVGDDGSTKSCGERGGRSSTRGALAALALLAVLALAAGLRFHGLGGHGLWQDEAYSFVFAIMPAGKFWKLMWSREGNMLLYYVLLRAWVHVGTSEFILRLPSVIFSLASVGMTYALGKQIFSKSTGLIAALLLSAHMLDLFLSQNARSYTLTVFLLLASAWTFVRMVRSPERKMWRLVYPLLAALAMYAQLLAILVIASQWLSLDGRRIRSMGWRRCLGVAATFFIVALPMEAFALLKNKGQVNWIPAVTWHGFMEGIYALSGYGGIGLLTFYAGLIGIAAVAALRASDSEYRFATRLAGAWLAFPVISMLVYSLHRPLFYSRFLVLCVPAATLLAGEGLATLQRLRSGIRWLWVPALLGMLALSLRSDWKYYRDPIWPDWKDSTRLVLANAHAGDAFCFSGNGAEVFLYYMQRERQVPWSKLPSAYYSHGVRCLEQPPEEIAKPGSGYTRVWLLKTDSTEEQYQWISGLLKPSYGTPKSLGTFPSPPGRIEVTLLRGSEK